MLCHEGSVSLKCFCGCALTVCLIFVPKLLFDAYVTLPATLMWGCSLYFLLMWILLKSVYVDKYYQVAIRAGFLGCVFSVGLHVFFLAEDHVRIFGIYMSVLALFHYSEYLSIAITNPAVLSTSAFMIDHSVPYTVAAVLSWAEFAVESYFFPGLKKLHWISFGGLLLCFGGELLRKSAIFTAKTNFNHLVQCVRAKDHELVTNGVYSLCRHPSYVGWFYWSIGTQVILVNPVCVVGYAVASWQFFYHRVMLEEMTLITFFGQMYCDYQQKVPTGLPFNKGVSANGW